jgi:hypothetical protein
MGRRTSGLGSQPSATITPVDPEKTNHADDQVHNLDGGARVRDPHRTITSAYLSQRI